MSATQVTLSPLENACPWLRQFEPLLAACLAGLGAAVGGARRRGLHLVGRFAQNL
jgi:hypothetical protein